MGFERDILNGVHRVETAVALVLGDVTTGVPLVRIHSQCFTGEMLGSLRPAALQSCKRLMRSSARDLLERAVKLENEEFAARVRSAEAKEAFTAFIEKRKPNFARANEIEPFRAA